LGNQSLHKTWKRVCGILEAPPTAEVYRAQLYQSDREILLRTAMRGKPGIVPIPSWRILDIILRRLHFPAATRRSLLRHEQDHYREALRRGWQARVYLAIFTEADNLTFEPFVLVRPPSGLSSFRRVSDLIHIIEAPAELCEEDERYLKKLRLAYQALLPIPER
jgi:hypothetical protein